MARNENMIAALKRERAGYVAHGQDDRVAQVDEQLTRYGYQPSPVMDDNGDPLGRTAVPQRTADAGPGPQASVDEAEKRGRGRPRKPRDDQGNIVRE